MIRIERTRAHNLLGILMIRRLALAVRQARALRAQRSGLAVQLGGAAGMLAALGAQGLLVAELLAEELGLAAPGVAAGAVAKIAHDITLLAQSLGSLL